MNALLDAAEPIVDLPAPATGIVTIYSYHLYEQPRRGGMHWLAEAFRSLGHDVRFVTCDFSLATLLKGDRRTKYGRVQGINRLKRLAPNLSAAVVATPFHALGRARGVLPRLLNGLTSAYPWPYAGLAASFARGSDLVVMESCGALMFARAVREATTAPIVYRVSDNLKVIRPVPSLLNAEQDAMQVVDAVSVASPLLQRRFPADLTRLDPMGLDRDRFDVDVPSPYAPSGRKRVVISGSSSFDHRSVLLACRAQPDWDFFQIGALDKIVDAPNFHALGERPYSDVVAYVRHADLGFAPYLVRAGFEYQAEHSNRLLQYVYCGLPSIVPEELSAGRPHYLGYRAGNGASIASTLKLAATFDRARVPRGEVIDWVQLALRLSALPRRFQG